MPQQASFGERVLTFWEEAAPPRLIGQDVDVLDARSSSCAREAMNAYYRRFYPDSSRRVFMIGINPGRFGGGITGIPFTDPYALLHYCGIPNAFEQRRELSSEFIYAFIQQFGGMEAFGRNFYLTAACPFGLVRGGKNINYYDIPSMQRALEPYIVETMNRQVEIGARRDAAIIIGTGKNGTVMERLNAEHGWFERLHAIEHPRFIMQYRRRRVDDYLLKYVELARSVVQSGTSPKWPDTDPNNLR